jgi:hypothetical protein
MTEYNRNIKNYDLIHIQKNEKYINMQIFNITYKKEFFVCQKLLKIPWIIFSIRKVMISTTNPISNSYYRLHRKICHRNYSHKA